MTALPKIRRRLTSFSLRTALVAITVFGVWLGLHLPSVKQQQISLEAFRSQGAYVRYDREVIGTPTSWSVIQHLPVPQWLVSTLGHDHFYSVVEVSTYKATQNQSHMLHTERMLQHLNGLPHLQVLELHLTPVDDESLRSISELKQLRKLNLGRAMDVTDEGVSYLSQLERLERLEMYYSNLTDTSVETLSSLESLEVLQLEGDFSEESLRHVRHLKNLRELTLIGLKSTKFSDEGLISVKDLAGLNKLSLWHLKITDEGLRHPMRLPSR